MTIREALKLHEDSSLLLSFVIRKDKAFLFTHPEWKLTKNQESKFQKLIVNRRKGIPVAYLTGQKEFFGLNFFVNKNVLIPRPETEKLVDLVCSFVRSSKSAVKILDVGTGSGCIIISIAKALYNLQPITYNLFASDISSKALAVAKENARIHKVKITFKQGDLLKPWKNQDFDIIVANLPYLAKIEDPSIRLEPRQALVAQKQGLAVIEKFLKQLSDLRGVWSSDPVMRPDQKDPVGWRGRTTKQSQPQAVFVEFDPRQTKKIKNLAGKYLPGYKIEIFKDLFQRNRFCVLQKPV